MVYRHGQLAMLNIVKIWCAYFACWHTKKASPFSWAIDTGSERCVWASAGTMCVATAAMWTCTSSVWAVTSLFGLL